MNVLITGGAGYIGSHTMVSMVEDGHNVICIDNHINSSPKSVIEVNKLISKEVIFKKVDLLNINEIERIFESYKIDAVIHFAALKAVGESVEEPLLYYNNNVSGTLNLLVVMKKFDVKKIVFSSSATVYGNPKSVPIKENSDLNTTNPYGATKLFIEGILKDLYISDPQWSIIVLRYFNPIGAHFSGKIGEDPSGVPNNIMPYISQVAIGKLKKLKIFGDDYDTHDGTGVRDYIHVVDLADGHVKALNKVIKTKGIEFYNLGTGKGYSVLDLVNAFEKVSNTKIPYEIVERRAGDISSCYADPEKAKKELGWTAKKTLFDMCIDTWNWQLKNPHGYS